MSMSSLPPNEILLVLGLTATTAMHFSELASFQLTKAPVVSDMSRDVVGQPPQAIGMRRAAAFNERLVQRPRFTSRNGPYMS
ncbi:MAG: hypothetical protein AAF988_00855 [Pseudomonadota bacterium]